MRYVGVYMCECDVLVLVFPFLDTVASGLDVRSRKQGILSNRWCLAAQASSPGSRTTFLARRWILVNDRLTSVRLVR